jgi:hypothetical protein
MPYYVNLNISEQLTFVNLPITIYASNVSISSSFSAPTSLIFLLSDIAKPQVWGSELKPVLGHIPTSTACDRELETTAFKQFFIRLENLQGKPFTPTSSFHLELYFHDGKARYL